MKSILEYLKADGYTQGDLDQIGAGTFSGNLSLSIQHALNDQDPSAARLFFPVGYYPFSDPLVIQYPKVLAGERGDPNLRTQPPVIGVSLLQWTGRRANLQDDSCAIRFNVLPGYTPRLEISDLTLSSTYPEVRTGIYFLKPCPGLLIRNVSIDGFNDPTDTGPGGGIYIETDSDWNDGLFENLSISNCSNGILTRCKDETNNDIVRFHFAKCRFGPGNARCGFDIWTLRCGSFVNCCFDANGQEGLRVLNQHGKDLAFYSCWFEGNWQFTPRPAGAAQIKLGSSPTEQPQNITFYSLLVAPNDGVADIDQANCPTFNRYPLP